MKKGNYIIWTNKPWTNNPLYLILKVLETKHENEDTTKCKIIKFLNKKRLNKHTQLKEEENYNFTTDQNNYKKIYKKEVKDYNIKRTKEELTPLIILDKMTK